MKTSRGFTQPNRILSFLRFGSGLTLIAAAAAMAFVAVNPSGPLLSQSAGFSQPCITAERSSAPTTATTAPPGDAPRRAGERAERLNGPEQERYDNMAYPNNLITEAAADESCQGGEGSRQNVSSAFTEVEARRPEWRAGVRAGRVRIHGSFNGDDLFRPRDCHRGLSDLQRSELHGVYWGRRWRSVENH